MKSAGKFFLIAAAIIVPATAVVLLTGSSSKTEAPPEIPKAEPGKPTTFLGRITPPAQVPKEVGRVEPPPNTEFVGFYQYKGIWIRIDVYPDSVIEDEAGGMAHTSMRYKAKFRWSILMGDTNVPLAIDDVETEGESWTVFDGLLNDATSRLIEEARQNAIAAAVNLAAQWIIVSGIKPLFAS